MGNSIVTEKSLEMYLLTTSHLVATFLVAIAWSICFDDFVNRVAVAIAVTAAFLTEKSGFTFHSDKFW